MMLERTQADDLAQPSHRTGYQAGREIDVGDIGRPDSLDEATGAIEALGSGNATLQTVFGVLDAGDTMLEIIAPSW